MIKINTSLNLYFYGLNIESLNYFSCQQTWIINLNCLRKPMPLGITGTQVRTPMGPLRLHDTEGFRGPSIGPSWCREACVSFLDKFRTDGYNICLKICHAKMNEFFLSKLNYNFEKIQPKFKIYPNNL